MYMISINNIINIKTIFILLINKIIKFYKKILNYKSKNLVFI